VVAFLSFAVLVCRRFDPEPKFVPFRGANTWFHWPTQSIIPDGIAIGSAVLPHYTLVASGQTVRANTEIVRYQQTADVM